ncbi:hypothetical protein [Pseudomonas massiliensis]|uniref:hypothetical protein n=1 Tax=Pseudomonas massiliensis TaxID=522492 RepID=UPI00058B3FE8|nr:hypothetical protein [Pseudomonas massiliensis]
MSAFYDRMADTALRLISQYGQTMTLREVTPGTYDPSTGETSPDAATETSVSGVLIEYTGQERQNNSLIQQGDKKVLMPAKGLAKPSLNSKILIQSELWTIVPPLKVMNPAGTPLVYELQVRR